MECVKLHHTWKPQLHAVDFHLCTTHFAVLYHLYTMAQRNENFMVKGRKGRVTQNEFFNE